MVNTSLIGSDVLFAGAAGFIQPIAKDVLLW
jgi:hypothetical protein